jgi:hypothetical protein
MENSKQPPQDRVGADLLLGATEIANALTEEFEREVTESEVYYIAKTKKLPIGRWGKNLISTRSKLRRAITAALAS